MIPRGVIGAAAGAVSGNAVDNEIDRIVSLSGKEEFDVLRKLKIEAETDDAKQKTACITVYDDDMVGGVYRIFKEKDG